MSDRMRLGLIVTIVLAASAQAQPYMIGTWFGHGQPGDGASMYIDRMKPNGDWRGEYRSCRRGKPPDVVQTGHWRLEGDILILKVETVDGLAQPRTDLYRMVSHDAHAQKYLSLPQNFAYTPTRAADNFTMPSCELVS